LLFPDIFDRPVVAKFDQRQGSSDGGAVLLKAVNQRLGLTSALAAGLKEERQSGKILHEIEELPLWDGQILLPRRITSRNVRRCAFDFSVLAP